MHSTKGGNFPVSAEHVLGVSCLQPTEENLDSNYFIFVCEEKDYEAAVNWQSICENQGWNSWREINNSR